MPDSTEVTLKQHLQNNKLKAWAGLERQSCDTSRMLPGQIVLQTKQWINVKSHLEILLQKVHCGPDLFFFYSRDRYRGQAEEHLGLVAIRVR